MKHLKKHIIAILLIVAGSSLTQGQSIADSITIYYVLHSDSTASVTSIPPQPSDSVPILFEQERYNYADEIVLKESIEKDGVHYIVNRIKAGAFKKKNITSITIPNTVTYIGNEAFRECKNLIGCDLGNTQCHIDTLGNYAFYESGIQYVYGNRYIDVLGDYVFNKCEDLQFINDNIIIQQIGSSAFSYCKQLKKAPLQKGLKKIDWHAFSDCILLDSIYIPQSVEIINYNPFKNCSNLASIEVDPKNPKYDSRDSCNAIITQINTYWWDSDYDKTLLVAGCSKTRIPNSIDVINYDAFRGTGIDTLNIPYGVKEIRESAFYGCSKLSAVQLPNSVTTMGRYVFKNCANLKSVILSDSISMIPSGCFEWCNSLQYIYIPEGISKISYDAFEYCSKLEKIVMPGSIKEVVSPFYKCDSLKVIYTSNTTPFKSIMKSKYTRFRIECIPNEDLRYYESYPIYFHHCFSKAQQKSPYESDAMWQARINNTERTQAIINKINSDYIIHNTTINPPSPQIGRYNADLEIFPIVDKIYGNIRLSVPYEDWQYVKANWNKAKIEATYEILDDKLVYHSMTVTMPSKKVYSSL